MGVPSHVSEASVNSTDASPMHFHVPQSILNINFTKTKTLKITIITAAMSKLCLRSCHSSTKVSIYASQLVTAGDDFSTNKIHVKLGQHMDQHMYVQVIYRKAAPLELPNKKCV